MKLTKFFVGIFTTSFLLTSTAPAFAASQCQKIVEPNCKGVVQKGHISFVNRPNPDFRSLLAPYNLVDKSYKNHESTIEIRSGITHQKFDLWVYDDSRLYTRKAIAPAVVGSKVKLIATMPSGEEIQITEKTTNTKGEAVFRVKTNLKAKQLIKLRFITSDEKVLYTIKMVAVNSNDNL